MGYFKIQVIEFIFSYFIDVLQSTYTVHRFYLSFIAVLHGAITI